MIRASSPSRWRTCSPGRAGRRLRRASRPVSSCTRSTTRHSAHLTVRRMVRYPWHPLFGQELPVRSGRSSDVVRVFLREGDYQSCYVMLPAWMLDETRCSTMRLQAEAHVDWRALIGLQRLLGDIATSAIDVIPMVRDPAHDPTTGSPTGAAPERPILPAWNTLPADCRDEVMRILARMLRDVAAGDRAARSAAEVDDE